MRSRLYLLTTNERKLGEWRRNFDRYGIEVRALPPAAGPDSIEALLRGADEGERVLAVCREQSDLVKPGTTEPSERLDLEAVENLTELTAWVLRDGRVERLRYEHRTPGTIDRSQGAAEGPGGWWDAIFRVGSTGLTYEELRQRGLKQSSRDMAISRFLLDHIYYRAPVDLRFSPQQPRRTIDFDAPLEPLLRDHEALRAAESHGIGRMLRAVERSGVFFRSAKNRREKIYWWPGLNAGIPFTPKGDAIHEITYLVHDFAHFLLPDLIFTGTMGPRGRALYIAHRMISEAVSLVLADMIFVDSLARAGLDYDFVRRRAHPVLAAASLDLTSPGAFVPSLRRLLAANVAYCVRGDDRAWRDLLGPAGEPALVEYESKYRSFFVEDFRWTERNVDGLLARRDEFARWWTLVEPLVSAWPLGLETLAQAEARLGDGPLVEDWFDRVFEERIRPIFEGPEPPLDAPEVRRERAFIRYLIGQLALFARYAFVPGADAHAARLVDFVLRHRGRIGSSEIARARAFYESFVALLASRNLISLDDEATYREVFPLFEPFYVFYDGPPGDYEPLDVVSARALGGL